MSVSRITSAANIPSTISNGVWVSLRLFVQKQIHHESKERHKQDN